MEKIIYSVDELALFCRQLIPIVKKNSLLLLEGPMGAGKTTLVRLLLTSLDIKVNVSSPTFNILQQYSLPKKKLLVNHLDCYRLENSKFLSSEIEMYFEEFNDCFNIIEWPEIIKEYNYFFKKYNWTKIKISVLDINARKLVITTNNLKFLKNLK